MMVFSGMLLERVFVFGQHTAKNSMQPRFDVSDEQRGWQGHQRL